MAEENEPISLQQESDNECSSTEEEILSTPEEPPVKALYFPDEDQEDTVNAHEGYNSDGNVPPVTTHWDTYHAEEILPSSEGPVEEQAVVIPTAAIDTFVLITDADIDKMKVDELCIELGKRGISKKGLKKDLVEKLKQAMIDKVPIIMRRQHVRLATDFHLLHNGN